MSVEKSGTGEKRTLCFGKGIAICKRRVRVRTQNNIRGGLREERKISNSDYRYQKRNGVNYFPHPELSATLNF